MNKALLDLYADYLISSFGPTTATGLSALVCGAVSHDAVTRLLANGGQAFTSRELWQLVKPLARQAQSKEPNAASGGAFFQRVRFQRA